mgnify:CR=1 FL=1
MRERAIEKKSKRFAAAQGWYVRKFKTANRRGLPDDIFIRQGVVLFIEFKKEGEEATEQQQLEHDRIRAQGIQVYVVDNFEDAKIILM